jgi:hypothetical protein
MKTVRQQEQELFNDIKNDPGAIAYGLSNDEIWDLVRFIRREQIESAKIKIQLNMMKAKAAKP